MARVRIIVEFYVDKSDSYFRARHILSEGLLQSPEMRWRKPTLHNVGNVVGQAIARERDRVAENAVKEELLSRAAAERTVEFFEMTNPDGTKDDSLRRAMTETPKFGVTTEWPANTWPKGPLTPAEAILYRSERRPWWKRLLRIGSPLVAFLDFRRLRPKGEPLSEGETPLKVSFTNLDRYRK